MGHAHPANMRTAEALPTPADPLAERLRSAGRALISALQEAAGSDLDPRRLTDLLDVAFTLRNQLDAALTAAVGTLDRGLEGDPEGAASLGLSCPAWLGFRLRLSAAAHAQVHLARRPRPARGLPDATCSGTVGPPLTRGGAGPKGEPFQGPAGLSRRGGVRP